MPLGDDGAEQLLLLQPRASRFALLTGISEIVGFVDGREQLVVRVGASLRVVDAASSLAQSELVPDDGWSGVAMGEVMGVGIGGGMLAVATPQWLRLHKRGADDPIRLGPSRGKATKVLFSERGDLVVAVSPRSVRAWETERGRLVYEYESTATIMRLPLRSEQLSLDASGTILAIATDRVVRLLHLRKRQRLDVAFPRAGGATGITHWLAFSPEGVVDGSPQSLSLLRYQASEGRVVGLADAGRIFEETPHQPGLLRDFSTP